MPHCDQSALVQGRHCGACTACCVYLPIPPGVLGPEGKPAGTACCHVGALGCRRYEQRPQICVDFRCAWLNDPAWPVAWRPDRCGLICLREVLDGQTPAGLIHEIRADALRSEVATAILDELQRTTALLAAIDLNRQETRFCGRLVGNAAHATLSTRAA